MMQINKLNDSDPKKEFVCFIEDQAKTIMDKFG